MGFWETLPGIITAWTAAVAGLAAAVKGVVYLWPKAVASWEFLKRVSRGAVRIVELADEDQWPNGAKSLPHAMREIYNRQGQTHQLIERHLEESKHQYAHHLEEWHQVDHGEEG